MKNAIPLLALILLMVSCVSPSAENKNESFATLEQISWKADESTHSMTLGVGDEIAINIWRHNELKSNVKIDLAGNVYLPLVGEIHAVNLTINKLRLELTKDYGQYIVNPQIDINPVKITSNKYNILGEIKTPGNYPLADEISLIDAIAVAGGVTKNANSNVLLIRQIQGQTKVFIANVNINDFIDEELPEEELEKNIMVANAKIFHHDIIYIPKSTIANVEDFMQRVNNIIAPLLGIQRATILWPDMIKAINDNNNNVIIAN